MRIALIRTMIAASIFLTSHFAHAADPVYRNFGEPKAAIQEFDSGEGLWAAQNLDGMRARVENGALHISLFRGASYFVPNSKDMNLGLFGEVTANFELSAEVMRDYLKDYSEVIIDKEDSDDSSPGDKGLGNYGIYWGCTDEKNFSMVQVNGVFYCVGQVENGQWSGSEWKPALSKAALERFGQLNIKDLDEFILTEASRTQESLLKTYSRLFRYWYKYPDSKASDSEILDQLGYSELEKRTFFAGLKAHASRLFGDPNSLRVRQEDGNLTVHINGQEIYSSTSGENKTPLKNFGVIMQKSGSITVERFAARTLGERADFNQAQKEIQAGNFIMALGHLEPLAEQGNDSYAQARLGQMYLEGAGVEQDVAQGISWLRRSAEQDNQSGQLTLATVLASGPPEVLNFEEAHIWARKAASVPSAFQRDAAYLLGFLLLTGQGGDQDIAEAKTWLEMAAEPPWANARALLVLGTINLGLYGNPPDDPKALDFIHRSAEKGEVEAAIYLGQLYAAGRGTQVDYQESYRWFWTGHQALPPGPAKDQVTDSLTQLKSLITAEQVEKAESDARQWLQAHR